MKKLILFSCLQMMALGVFSQSMTTKDSQFAMDAAQASLLEIKLSELTITKAVAKDVKVLGQQMVLDHTKANNELKALAVTKNLVLPTTLTREGQMRYDELSRKSGADFDKAYTKQMVADHEKAIALFKEENLSGSDNEFKSWASTTLPILEHHLMMSKDADVMVNKTIKETEGDTRVGK